VTKIVLSHILPINIVSVSNGNFSINTASFI
jgi:hypothetical protein